MKIFRFDFSERGITFFSGCIRGAIAFGLAISMPGESEETLKNKKMLISSTLILVFITTILFGALMSPIVKFFTRGQSKKENIPNIAPNQENFQNYSLQGFDGETFTFGEIESYLDNPNRKRSKIHGIWHNLDEKYLKPIFIDNYESAREEHSQIAKEIMQLFENHERKKLNPDDIQNNIREMKNKQSNNEIEKEPTESDNSNSSSTNLLSYKNN